MRVHARRMRALVERGVGTVSVKEQLMTKNQERKRKDIRIEYVERSLKYIRFRISVDFIFDGFLKKEN